MIPFKRAGTLTRAFAIHLFILMVSAVGDTNTAVAAQRSVCSNQELAAAIDAARPGDEILLCAGTWEAQVVFDVEGTASAPIVLKAAEPGEVVMKGSSTLRLVGSHAIVDGLVWTGKYTGGSGPIVQFRGSDGRVCNNCRLTNAAIIDYNPADPSQPGVWILVEGQHNRVDHSYFSGKSNDGTVVRVYRRSNNPDHARIDHNFFSRPKNVDANGGETIQIGTSGTYAASDSLTTVESNYFYRANGELEVVSNKSSGNVISHNTFRGSQGAVFIRYGNRVRVEANYFFGDGEPLTGGVRAFGEGHTIANNYFEGLNPTGSDWRGAISLGTGDAEIDAASGFYFYPRVRDVLVAHNTIVDSVNSLYFFRGGKSGDVVPENVKIVNNIVSNTSGPLIVESVTPKNVTYLGNIFHGQRPDVDETLNFFGSPDLVRNGGGVLRVAEASIAVKAAAPVDDVKNDIDGTVRSDSTDVGADEYKDPDDFRVPVGLCDVGPDSYRPGLKSECTETRRRPRPPGAISAIAL